MAALGARTAPSVIGDAGPRGHLARRFEIGGLVLTTTSDFVGKDGSEFVALAPRLADRLDKNPLAFSARLEQRMIWWISRDGVAVR